MSEGPFRVAVVVFALTCWFPLGSTAPCCFWTSTSAPVAQVGHCRKLRSRAQAGKVGGRQPLVGCASFRPAAV
eukprot:5084800-Lingulodinium_polyedra.AAC.1